MGAQVLIQLYTKIVIPTHQRVDLRMSRDSRVVVVERQSYLEVVCDLVVHGQIPSGHLLQIGVHILQLLV